MVREKATFTRLRTCAVEKRTDYLIATGNPLLHGSVTTPSMWDFSVVSMGYVCEGGREGERERTDVCMYCLYVQMPLAT